MNTPVVAGLLFAAFCAWMLLHAIRNHRNAQASLDWPGVDGRMVELGLWGKRNIGGQMKEVNNLSVKYEFRVEGTLYTGTTAAFYTLVYPETVAFADEHSEDGPVTVYYNPARPSESVLVPGPRGGNQNYSEIIIGVIALLLAVAVTVGGALGIIG